MAYTYNNLYKISMIGLRYFTVYGPWGRPDMAMYIFTKNIIEGKPISVFNNGKMKRDLTFIDDIIAGTVSSIKNNYEKEIFNLGNNRSEQLLDMISIIEQKLNKKAIIEKTPMQAGDVKESFADIEYSKEKLNFIPKTKINEGIPKFIDWYKDYHSLK